MQETEEDDQVIVAVNPPCHFGIVAPCVYRSCVFGADNFGFVETLSLKSLISLSPELPPKDLKDFLSEANIEFNHLGLKLWRRDVSWKPVSEELVKETIEFMLDTSNHPCMIMCSSGVHETGTIVGCLRKILDWNMNSISDEYHRFAGIKAKDADLLFVELFDPDLVSIYRGKPEWLERQNIVRTNRYSDSCALPLISDPKSYDPSQSLCVEED